MYYIPYSADSMEFTTLIVQTLQGAISPIRACISIVSAHGTTFRPCVVADLYGLEINAEHILRTVNGDSHILA